MFLINSDVLFLIPKLIFLFNNHKFQSQVLLPLNLNFEIWVFGL